MACHSKVMVMFDIIIPTYKVSEEFIERCLASVESQTFDDWHCWIADGTPENDETFEPFMKIVSKYTASPQFTYMRQSGKGVSQARNEAISLGQAKYVATLDGDDLWYPEHLQWMVESIEQSDESVVMWWAGADAEIQLQSLKTNDRYLTIGLIGWFEQYAQVQPRDIYFFLRGNPVIPSNTVVLRSRFEQVGGYNEQLQIGEDTDLYLRLVGNPLEVGYQHTYQGRQVDAVSGYHGCGPWQTTSYGSQTSAADGKDFWKTKEVLSQQATGALSQLPEITLQDQPDDVEDDYWAFIVEMVMQKHQETSIFEIG